MKECLISFLCFVLFLFVVLASKYFYILKGEGKLNSKNRVFGETER